MNTLTDPQLLREYVVNRSDSALTTLVHRHFDLVHSAARRILGGDATLAQDVAQEVFRTLILKAPELLDRSSLAGWLHAVTHAEAVNTVRAEDRRRAREHEAAAMNLIHAHPSNDPWQHVAPHLDAVLMELPEHGREAVIQHFFHHKSIPAIAAAEGISEQSARRRVHRAIEEMRDLFERRGVRVGAGALGAVLWANAVQSAPAGMAASVAASLLAAQAATLTAAGTAATAGTITTSTGSGLAAMVKLKAAVAVGTLVGLVGAGLGLHEAREARAQRAAVHALQQQLAEQADQHRREVEEARRQVATEQEWRRQFQARVLQESRSREELTRRGADLVAWNQVLATNTPESRAWMLRAAQLQERAQAVPAMQTPEMQWVTAKDWLDASKEPVDTEEAMLAAFSTVRALVEGRFARQVHEALQRHRAASDGRFPTQMEQLAPYFDPPLDPALLARWQVVPAEGDGVDERLIRLTAVDPVRDVHWAVDGNGPRASRIMECGREAAAFKNMECGCAAAAFSAPAKLAQSQLSP